MHLHHFLLFCVAFSLLSPVFPNGDHFQALGCCTYRGSHFEDIEYTLRLFLNQYRVAEFNSTEDSWTGFTEYAVDFARTMNSYLDDKFTRRVEKKMLCENIAGIIHSLDNLTIVPTIRLKAVKQPSMLVCSAYSFYPKQIGLTWLRNGQEVTTGISYSQVMSDGEFYYQIHSYLEFTPTHGEEITCMVEHYSLSEPALLVWEPSLPVAQRIQTAVGLCGLMLGFSVLICGLIYYKKKCAAYVTVIQGPVMIPVEHLPADGAT